MRPAGILDEWSQQRANVLAATTGGRVVIDGEDGDGALAATVDDTGLPGQAAVTVDAGVDAARGDVVVGEELGSGVEGGVVDRGAVARHAGLDEGWGHAGLVDEGCYEGVIHTF